MFGAPIPLIQAPMLGASTLDMAREACLAGAIGSLALAGSAPDAIGSEIEAMRAAVGACPFAANLFILEPVPPAPAGLQEAIARLAPLRAELGLPEEKAPSRFAEDFGRQFEALLEAAPPIASFAFGVLSPDRVEALHARGVSVFGTATTPREAIAWAEAGADAIVAQGMEAGGHRGTFLHSRDESLIGLVPLITEIRSAVACPVIAAGGIMDGRAIVAMLALGASAVQMGTAFLLASESRASLAWKAALIAADAESTRITRAFSGRDARGIENAFMKRFDGVDVPAYPVQNALTQEVRARAATLGRADLLSLWAGQGVGCIRQGGTAELIAQFWQEASNARDELGKRPEFRAQ